MPYSFTSENDKVIAIIRAIAAAAKKLGIYVYERGGDGAWLFKFFIEEGLDFIVRLVGDRNLLHWNGCRSAEGLADECEMKYRDHVTFKSHGREVDVPIEYGSLPVRLPDHPDRELRQKVGILAESVKRISQRMFEMPDFHFYAIADGASMLFTRHGRWNGLDGPNECDEPKGLFQATLAI